MTENYAEVLERELLANGVKIGDKIDNLGPGKKIIGIAPNGSYYNQMYVDALEPDFGVLCIEKLAKAIAEKYIEVSFADLVLPHTKQAESQKHGNVSGRLMTDYVAPSTKENAYSEKIITRFDVLFQGNK